MWRMRARVWVLLGMALLSLRMTWHRLLTVLADVVLLLLTQVLVWMNLHVHLSLSIQYLTLLKLVLWMESMVLARR